MTAGTRNVVNDPISSTSDNKLALTLFGRQQRLQGDVSPQDVAYFTPHRLWARLLPISSFVFLCVLVLLVYGYSLPSGGLSQNQLNSRPLLWAVPRAGQNGWFCKMGMEGEAQVMSCLQGVQVCALWGREN